MPVKGKLTVCVFVCEELFCNIDFLRMVLYMEAVKECCSADTKLFFSSEKCPVVVDSSIASSDLFAPSVN